MATGAIAGYVGAVYYRPRMIKTTISFADTNPDTILDSGNGFVDAGFLPAKNIVISGSTSNDGSYLVATVTRGTITLDGGETLTAEVAGDLVTIIQTEEVQLLGFYNWSLPYEILAIEATSYDSNGYKEYITSLKSWGVSASRYFQTGAIITADTIAFVDSNPDTITDSGNGFLTAGFKAGGRINVSGAANAGNNGSKIIETAAAGTLTLISTDTLTAEGVGASVTIVQPITLYPGNTYHTRFYIDKSGAKYFYGNCIVTNRTLDIPVDGIVGIDLSFMGSGVLTPVGL